MRDMPGQIQRLTLPHVQVRPAARSCVWVLSLVVGLTAATAGADFEAAADAYRRQDYVSAYAQFEPLALAGDPRAQTVIALMFKYGESVKPNYQTAFNWYLRAAEQGYAPAQFNVGVMLAEGQGLAPNREEGLVWLRKAASNGYDGARGELTRVGQSVGRTTGEIKEWSQAWDFRLPSSYRYETDISSGATPASATTQSATAAVGISVVTERFKVQLGAMRTQSAAEAHWTNMVAAQPELLGDLPTWYVRSEGNRVVYRLQAGPFDSLAAARAFCGEVHSAAGCLPLKSTSD